MLNAKSSENFLSPEENWANFWRFGGREVRGYTTFRFLLQKAHLCVNRRRLSHFALKFFKGCDLPVGWENTQQITQTAIYERHVAVNTGLELPFSL